MKVAVAYAEAKRQMVIEMDVADGTSAEQAIRSSGILGKIPDIDLAKNKIGVFGKLFPLEQALSNGDRVEIYRPAIGKPPKKAGSSAKTGAGSAAKPQRAGRDTRSEKVETDLKAKQPPSEVRQDTGQASPTDGAPDASAVAAAKAARLAATKARIAAAKAKLKEKGVGKAP